MHGVYKPGNVKLEPKILRDSQTYVQEQVRHGRAADQLRLPRRFGLHAGRDRRGHLSYGVVKMNIDTDTQWALWDGVHAYYQENEPYLQTQLGNPDGPDAPNKKYYDPRKWLRIGEEYFVARMMRACEELNNINTLG